MDLFTAAFWSAAPALGGGTVIVVTLAYLGYKWAVRDVEVKKAAISRGTPEDVTKIVDELARVYDLVRDAPADERVIVAKKVLDDRQEWRRTQFMGFVLVAFLLALIILLVIMMRSPGTTSKPVSNGAERACVASDVNLSWDTWNPALAKAIVRTSNPACELVGLHLETRWCGGGNKYWAENENDELCKPQTHELRASTPSHDGAEAKLDALIPSEVFNRNIAFRLRAQFASKIPGLPFEVLKEVDRELFLIKQRLKLVGEKYQLTFVLQNSSTKPAYVTEARLDFEAKQCAPASLVGEGTIYSKHHDGHFDLDERIKPNEIDSFTLAFKPPFALLGCDRVSASLFLSNGAVIQASGYNLSSADVGDEIALSVPVVAPSSSGPGPKK